MTSKYQAAKALAARGGSVTIKGNKQKKVEDQTVSGGEIVDKMETVEVTAAAGEKPGNPATNAQTETVVNSDGSTTSSIVFWSNGRSGASKTFGHEVLHSIYPEKVGLRGGWNKYLRSEPNLHDDSFDDASDDIR